MILLLLIVSCISDVHSVVRWKPRVWHTLLSSGCTVVVTRYALPEHTRVARIGALLRLLLHALTLLWHLYRSPIVLLVLMGMFNPAIAQVRDIRIREIRTHATVSTLLTTLSVYLYRFSFAFSFLFYCFSYSSYNQLVIFLPAASCSLFLNACTVCDPLHHTVEPTHTYTNHTTAKLEHSMLYFLSTC